MAVHSYKRLAIDPNLKAGDKHRRVRVEIQPATVLEFAESLHTYFGRAGVLAESKLPPARAGEKVVNLARVRLYEAGLWLEDLERSKAKLDDEELDDEELAAEIITLGGLLWQLEGDRPLMDWQQRYLKDCERKNKGWEEFLLGLVDTAIKACR